MSGPWDNYAFTETEGGPWSQFDWEAEAPVEKKPVSLMRVPPTTAQFWQPAVSPPGQLPTIPDLTKGPLGEVPASTLARARLSWAPLGGQALAAPEAAEPFVKLPTLPEKAGKAFLKFTPLGQALKLGLGDETASATIDEIWNQAKSIPEFFTSIQGMAAGLAGAVAPEVTGAAFGGITAKQFVDQLADTITDWKDMSGPERARSIIRTAGAGGLFGLITHGMIRQPRAAQPVPPVIPEPTAADIQATRPAIKLVPEAPGAPPEIVVGKKGETHPDIIKAEGLKPEQIEKREFVGPTGEKSREQVAAQIAPVQGTEFEPTKAHSVDLAKAQEKIEVEKPAAPTKPYETTQAKPDVVPSVPKGTEERFKEIADYQRGEPEEAMREIQRHQISQLYGFLAEHVGDLTHRMSEYISHLRGGGENVGGKVRRTLRELKSGYGIEREIREQIESNLKFHQEHGKNLQDTFESQFATLKLLGKQYAEAHKRIPVFNDAQRLAQSAAVAIGEFRLDDARRILEKIDTYIKDGSWERRAMEPPTPTAPKPPAPTPSDVPPGQSALMAGATPTVPEPAQTVKRVVRGLTGLRRFTKETELQGPDVLSWIHENMKLLSKSQAKAAWGKEKFTQNASLWDDSAPLSQAHHNVIYSEKGYAPDRVAQAAYEAGVIKEPSVNALWDAIKGASKKRSQVFKTAKREEAFMAEEEKQHSEWLKATAKGEERINADDLKVGDFMDVEGQEVEVTNVDPEGNVTLKDGRRFGTQVLPSGSTIHVQDFSEFVSKGELFGPEEMPFNLAGEQAAIPEERPPESKTGYGTQQLAQQEMFAIQKIVADVDPSKSADAAQKMYGGPTQAIAKLENQLRVTDADPETRKAFTKDQRGRLKEVISLLRQRATKPAEPGAAGRGGELQMAIVPGVKEFVEQDLVPFAKEAAKTIGETAQQVKALVAPPGMGEPAALGAGIIRERRAELAQRDVQMREKFAKNLREMDSLSPQASLAFIDRVERGLTQPTPELARLQQSLRDEFNRRVREVRALGTGKLQHVIQDYFPHIWKNPDDAISWYARILGKRPLRGPASFLNHRTIPTTADGVAANLEPVTWNPVELSLLKFHEMDRYVMGQKIFQEYKDKGLAEFSRSDIPPEGYARIDDRIANVVQYRPTTRASGAPGAPERILRGHWYVQEDAARVLNNFLSPGLSRYQWFRAIRWSGNTLNMAQLGLSGYHFMFTMIDSGTSKLSLGIEELARGKTTGAVKLAQGLVPAVNQLEYYYRGNKVLQEYTKPGSVGGEYRKIVDALLASGGRVEMPRIFQNNAITGFMKAARSGNYPGAIIRAPFAAIEAVSYPLMQNIVPRLKLGVFADMALSEIERMGPNVTRDQFRRNMGKIWDSVDNRMGELVYDNLFWNRNLKDLSFLSVRAVGWNLGTIRELGGGLVDSATVISRIRSGDPIMTRRMAYVVSLPITVGIMGAIYQYMKTGQGPQELRDYFYPKTGRTLPDGTPERVNFPSYLKDIASYSMHPFVTVGHKLHPMWSELVDMFRNRDFYGQQIRNPDDPLVKQVAEELAFVGKNFEPFSMKGAERRVGAKESIPTKAESFFGIMPISPEIARTAAQNKIMEYSRAKLPAGARTPEQIQRQEFNRDIEAQLQAPKDYEKTQRALIAAEREGKLTRSQRLYQQNKLRFQRLQMDQGRTKAEAQWLWRFEHLNADEAQHVYDISTPAEKKLFDRTLRLKLQRARIPMTETER